MITKFLPSRLCGIATIGILAALANPAKAAVTAIQTISFGATGDGTFTDLDGSDINLGASQLLGSFDQFDPLLGTLTEIRFTVQVRASIEVSVGANELLDMGMNFSVLLDDSASFFQTSVIYYPTGGSFGKSVTIDYGSFGQVGEENVDPSGLGTGEDFHYQSEVVIVDYGGFANGNSDPTLGSLLASDPDINLDDFVGTGTVPGLQLGLFGTFGTSASTLDNVASGFLEASLGLDAGEVTLQYVYTPIPEPTVPVLILGCGALLVIRRRR